MLLLATDLDGTFLGGKSLHKQQLYRLIRESQDIRLVFVTGRGLETVIPLLNDPVIPNPDYIICDVGATIVNGRTLEPIQPLQSNIEEKWPGRLPVRNKLKKVKGLRWQEVPQARRCSYYFDDNTDLDQLYSLAESMGCDILKSAGKFLDVLPPGVNKGSTLRQLVKLLHFPAENILVAGDTLNDLSLFETGYKGVVVGYAEKGLLEATRDIPHIYQARQPGCGGILESMEQFHEFKDYYASEAIRKVTPTSGDNQLLMVYHRLPYEIIEVNGQREMVPPRSPNGIIPSLMGFFSSGRAGTWIAWEEVEKKKENLRNIYVDEKKYPNLLASRIALTKKDVDLFYKVFSKEAFWPTIFSFIDKATFNHSHWEHFVKVNRQFAEKTAAEADHEAFVWIHDYNLWMVPGYLRQLRPDLRIAFFHHTSFPPADIFNIIPWRGEIIGSLLQCDYIGFHIPRYVENFMDVVKSQMPVKVMEEVNTTERFLSYSCPLGVEKMTREIEAGGRRVRLGAHPIGVNVGHIAEIYNRDKTQEAIRTMRQQIGDDKQVILSLERLDYVKGPLEKIYAFQEFLEQYPEFHGKIELINICTPPAKGMKVYEKIQQELEQAIGKINGKYSRFDWTPIHFFFRAFPFEEVVAYYGLADIAWITPLRDGLNLVAKEYVATQGLREESGVLLLSEFAGASVELGYALRTNPYDRKSLKEGLLQALVMEPAERQMRMKRLYDSVQYYNIDFWGNEFLGELESIQPENEFSEEAVLA